MAKEPKKEDNVQTSAAAPAAPETVSVPKEQFQALMDAVTELKSQNQMLIEIADRGRLDSYMMQRRGTLPTYVKVSTFDFDGTQKIVTGWKMTTNDVYRASNGAWVEHQQCEIYFEDGMKAVDVSLPDFYRKTANKIRGEVLDRVRDQKGNDALKLKLEDGREIVIGATFIN